MISLLSTIPSKILIVGAMVGAAWIAGYVGGQKAGRAAQMADTLAAFSVREKIDEAVSDLDYRQLCIGLGGVPEQCDELRRVAKAANGE
ncbi:MAG: hypothetical protein WC829_02025 [Hyphomicrobium sp.]|jgi:hypothetical protein